jgi:O-antigen ligase
MSVHQRLSYASMQRSQAALRFTALALLLVALLLGGATQGGFQAQAAVRMVGLGSLLMAIWLSPSLWASGSRFPLLLLAAAIMVPLLQLIPLSPAVWTQLPQRTFEVEAYRAAGLALPWLPMTLAPYATWNAAYALVPPTAMFLLTLSLETPERRALVPWVLAVAAGSVLLGIGQVADGPMSPLRFYTITNASEAVGFFSNRNHQAGFLAAVVPLAAYWAMGLTRRRQRWILATLGVGMALIFAVGVGVSGSRAGVLLLAGAGLGCVLMFARNRRLRPSGRTLALGGALILVGLIPALAFGLREILHELPAAMATDPRARAFPIVLKAAVENLPFGTGLGTFDPVYRALETPQIVTHAYLNHAHDDYLELFLQTGVVGAVLIILFLVWFFWASARAWRAPAQSQTAQMGRAASVSIAILLAHSVVDYPLRTAALATLFAFLCGCLATSFPKTRPPQPPVE